MKKLLFSNILIAFLIAGCGGDDSDTSPPVEAPLTKIIIEPSEHVTFGVPTLSVIKDQQIPFKATGEFKDGSQQDLTHKIDWASDSASITIGRDGNAIGQLDGEAKISARYLGITSNSIDLKVISPTLSGIVITLDNPTLPINTEATVKAIGRYQDGITANITLAPGINWNIENNLARINKNKIMTANHSGKDNITVEYQGITSDPISIDVTEATIESLIISNGLISTGPISNKITIQEKLTHPFTATAIYSDNTRLEVTKTAKWTSSNPNIATIDKGLATAINIGNTDIKASISDIDSQSIRLNVVKPNLENIEIISSKHNLNLGDNITLTAQAIFSNGIREDITTQVKWSSSDSAIISIDNNGNIQAIDLGQANIRAQMGTIEQSLTLTVIGSPITKIELNSPSAPLKIGQSHPLKVTASNANNIDIDITNDATFTASPSNIIEISEKGVITARQPGAVTVTAEYNQIKADTIINVADFDRIIIEPRTAHLALGETKQLKALGIYDDIAEKEDITNKVSWSLINPDNTHLILSNQGQVTGLKASTENDNIKISFGSHEAIGSVLVDMTNRFKIISLDENSSSTTELSVLSSDGIVYQDLNKPFTISIEGEQLTIKEMPNDLFTDINITNQIRNSTYPSAISAFITNVQYSYKCTELGAGQGLCNHSSDDELNGFLSLFGTRLNFDKEKPIQSVYSGEYLYFRTEDAKPITYSIIINTDLKKCLIHQNSNTHYECRKLSVNSKTGEFSAQMDSINLSGHKEFYGELIGSINGINNEFMTGFISNKNTSDNSIDIFSISRQ
ncbi:MAG: Ig-like domain-containing protein [Vibrio sp.]|uniref:Ig-like domain-containing protein n=1 Tax=Vibrio sp. TaxID=678 RepID=UPI003F3992F9